MADDEYEADDVGGGDDFDDVDEDENLDEIDQNDDENIELLQASDGQPQQNQKRITTNVYDQVRACQSAWDTSVTDRQCVLRSWLSSRAKRTRFRLP
uniref:Putative dna-directed rna polymerase i n=1 Tax=Ixodes ricinus TaxID=34613 RepID=V5HLH6_IXORI